MAGSIQREPSTALLLLHSRCGSNNIIKVLKAANKHFRSFCFLHIALQLSSLPVQLDKHKQSKNYFCFLNYKCTFFVSETRRAHEGGRNNKMLAVRRNDSSWRDKTRAGAKTVFISSEHLLLTTFIVCSRVVLTVFFVLLILKDAEMGVTRQDYAFVARVECGESINYRSNFSESCNNW